MSKFVVANWKMNKNNDEARAFCKVFLKQINKRTNNFCICPPHTCLATVSECLRGVGMVGAQNVYFATKGAFTGEISPEMIKSCGANYCIIGHSERRNLFGETDEFVAKKLKFATENGLKVIFCVGEHEDEHTKILSVLKHQLKALNGADLTNVVLAYEPIWAIGTGKVATIKDIKKAHGIILDCVQKEFNIKIPCLYGGSVNSCNAKEILALEEVAGVLVGGASLDPVEFAKLVNLAK